MRHLFSLFANIATYVLASSFAIAIAGYLIGYTIGWGVGIIFPLGA